MTRTRWLLVVLAVVVLLASLAISLAGSRCAAFGEAFDLTRWQCVPAAPPPINLQRDLQRT